MNQINKRLSLFRELITCTHNLTFSTFNRKFENIYCNHDHFGPLFILLAIDELQSLNQLASLAGTYPVPSLEHPRPTVCTNSFGMLWISECEYHNGYLSRIHVLGPVFTTDYSLRKISQRIDELHLSVPMKKDFLQFVEALPVIPLIHMHEYACMLHYCLYQEKISVSDFTYQSAETISHSSDPVPTSVAPEQTYLATKNLLDMVESGNLEYQNSMNRLASLGYLSNNSEDFLRQAKTAVITFTALCCHAAIRGGLPSATAYLLSDRYLECVEDCKTVSGISEINKAMLQDYIQRVHRIKSLDSTVSPGIQSVCDRFAMSPEITPDIPALAAELGYSESYFSRKFHQETGFTVKEYLLEQKIEKAKTLLKTTNMNVIGISEALGFCSPSYFGKLFKKSTGLSPGDYRAQTTGVS